MDTAAIATIVERAQSTRSLSAALKVVSAGLLNIFDGSGIVVAIENRVSSRRFVSEGMRDLRTRTLALRHRELEGSESGACFFDLPAEVCAIERDRSTQRRFYRAFRLGRDGRFHRTPCALSDSFIDKYLAEAMLSTSLQFGVWSVRVWVLAPGRRGPKAVRQLQIVMRRVAPAVHSVYLSRRLRTRVQAAERARLSRELHDSVIQMLISLRMEVQVLRRRDDIRFSKVAAELERFEQRVDDQVHDVRHLMQELKPLDVSPAKLPELLVSVVGRFERETGIRTRFFSELSHVALPRAVCGEVIRIVEEALFNVRKHAGARNAVVQLAQRNGSYHFEIHDDGVGYCVRRGPAIITERVRQIGGRLTIESIPGHGSQLKIVVPRRVRSFSDVSAASMEA